MAGAAYAAEEDAFDLEAKVAPFRGMPLGNAYARTVGSSCASLLYQGVSVSATVVNAIYDTKIKTYQDDPFGACSVAVLGCEEGLVHLYSDQSTVEG